MKAKIIKYILKIQNKSKKNFVEGVLLLFYGGYKKAKKRFFRSESKSLAKMYYSSMYLKRFISNDKYHFVSFNELVFWVDEWIKTFPTSYDLIIGIPRSGLLVANLIALKLGKPLTTPDNFQKIIWKSKHISSGGQCKNILLVDDSITTGKTMKKNLNLVKAVKPDVKITTAAVIVNKNTKKMVDVYYVSIPRFKRLFEWNMLHSKKGVVAIDMDGILCEEPRAGLEEHDKEGYIKWLKEARPYLVPTFEIDFIITNRLEKYRAITEKWLKKHRVRYKRLIMWNIGSVKEKKKGRKTRHKIETLLKIKPKFYWESSYGEAKDIWESTKIPTICVESKTLFN